MGAFPSAALQQQAIDRNQPSPVEQATRLVALKGLLAKQQQDEAMRPIQQQAAQNALTQQQLELEVQKRAMAQQNAMDEAYKNAVTVDPETGMPKIDQQHIINYLQQSGHGSAIPTVSQSLMKFQESNEQLQKLHVANQQATLDYFADIAHAVKAAGYDPVVASSFIGSMAQTPGPFQQQAAQTFEQIKQNPAAIKPFVDQIEQASIKQRETAAAEYKAQQADKNKTEAQLAFEAAQEPGGVSDKALKRLDQSRLASRPVVNNILPGMPNAAATTGKSGDEYLATLPAGVANQVKAIAEGRAMLPSGATRSQAAQQLRAAVFQYDPSYSDQRAQVRKAFTTGPDGRNIGALNTAAVHLDTLGEVSKGLANGSIQTGNQLKNYLTAQFGGAAPTNFEGVKDAVAGEMASALKGQATDIEINKISQSIQSKNSPAQLAEYINNQLHIIQQKLDTYQQRYRQQIPDDSTWSPVLPQANAVFQKHSGGDSSKSDFFSQFGGKKR